MEWRRLWTRGQRSDLRGVISAVGLPLEGAHPPAILAHLGPASGERVMRAFAITALVALTPALLPAASKLTWEDRVELTRGLTFEYATVKVLLPRARKPLEFDSKGTWDKGVWATVAREGGPAARTGDQVQVTKITIEDDKIIFEINGGFRGGKKWYQGVQISGGMGGAQVPLNQGND